MRELRYEQAVVVGGIALKLHAVTARAAAAKDGGAVDSDIDLIAGYLVKAVGLGLGGGEVGHEAACWILFLGRSQRDIDARREEINLQR